MKLYLRIPTPFDDAYIGIDLCIDNSFSNIK